MSRNGVPPPEGNEGGEEGECVDEEETDHWGVEVEAVELLVNKTGVEADTGMLEAQGLPQLEQVEIETGQAEGETKTEAPGSPCVGQEPHPGGSGSWNSEIKSVTERGREGGRE